MRELTLNGYIDEESWFGDEITPESLHEMLYDTEEDMPDDVHIRLNSYGGSCNAAVRMFDDIRAYPGNVLITVSGTAASAATVVAMAADSLEITPGSLWMIHDPSTVAIGNERDMDEAKAVLRACKESILNIYGRRMRVSRNDAAEMMSASTWMDANEAFDKGFVDCIAVEPNKLPTDEVVHKATLDNAKAGVQKWFDRKARPFITGYRRDVEPTVDASVSAETDADDISADQTEKPTPTVESADVAPGDDRVSITQTDNRLENLRY